MADFFTHFSCLLHVGKADNAAQALDLAGGSTIGWLADTLASGRPVDAADH